MTANAELQPVREAAWLRGFSSLFYKEMRTWWGTRRWWINALIWPLLLGVLMANMMWTPALVDLASEAELSAAGGLVPYSMLNGISVFFEVGALALAIGAIILSQDTIIGEKQSGVAEWLLAKPLQRRSYLLAKMAASALSVSALLVLLPSAVAYMLLGLRGGGFYPIQPFLAAVGILELHTLFYLALTLALGAFFNSRAPILGITLGTLIGGTFLASLFRPLLYVTPWVLGRIASLTASGEMQPLDPAVAEISGSAMTTAPLIATAVWIAVFIAAALAQFEQAEF